MTVLYLFSTTPAQGYRPPPGLRRRPLSLPFINALFLASTDGIRTSTSLT